MSSNDRMKNVLMGNQRGNASKRKVRSLLGRAVSATVSRVRTAVDSLEGRRLLANPVADTGGPYNVNEGSTITIDGGASTDDGSIVAYAWDLNYKPLKGFRRGVTGQAFTFEAGDSTGPRTIALKVTDNDGNTNIATTTLTIDDVEPTVTLTGDATADEGQVYNLAWSSTDPGDDTITGYSIDWGDGVTTSHDADESSATHVYNQDDNYTITFTATDEDGSHVTTKNITVNDVAPQIVAGLVNSTINEGDQARVNFASPNRGGSIDQWIIDWGDDSVSVRPGSKSFAQHVYADNGTYTVTVTALEIDGTATDATLTLTVNNVAPTFTLGGIPDESPEGDAITATHTAPGDVGVNDTFSYAWELKKGNATVATSNTTGNYTFTPTDNGTYTLTLTVSDNDGEETVHSKTFLVTNVAPTGNVTATVPSPFYEGDTVQFTANPSDAGAGDTFTYSWRVEKNGNPWTLPNGLDTTSATFDFTPTDEGSYVVGCAITDDDGATYIASSATLTVVNANPVSVATGGTNANEGVSQSFAANASDMGDEDVLSYAWTVTKDGNPYTLPGNVVTTGSTLVFTPDDNGDYFATVTVTDADGGTITSSSSQFTVSNVAPTGVMGVPGIGLTEGNVLNFTITASDAGTADTFGYAWSVTKDGNPFDVSGETTNADTFHFTPDDEGTYVVSCAIVDDDGGSVTKNSGPIVVANAAPTATISTPAQPIYEGDMVSLTATPHDAGANDSVSYLWTVTKDGAPYTLAPGTVDNTQNFDFVVDDDGVYVATVTVSDGTDSSTATRSFGAANKIPTANITGAPLTAPDEGDTLNLTVNPSDAGVHDTFTYRWIVYKDGVEIDLDAAGVTKNLATFTFTLPDDGDYDIGCMVEDNAGYPYLATVPTFTANNVAPTGNITGVPLTHVNEGALQTFTAVPADAGSDDTFSYAWSVEKDGNPYTLPGDVAVDEDTLAFTPSDNGDYIVTVVITDDDGDYVTVTATTFSVDNVAPGATVAGPTTGAEGSALTFTATKTDAGSADTHTYSWTVEKDGAPYALPGGVATNNATLTFTPDDEGSYVATVRVSDDDGDHFDASSSAAVVANVAPNVTVTGGPSGLAAENVAVTYGTTVTDAGVNDTKTYAWSVTRNGVSYDLTGVTTNAASFTFTPKDNGTYVMSVAVTDNDGATTTQTKTLEVLNVAPLASVTTQPPSSIAQGSSATYIVSAQDQSPIDTLTYAWHVTRNGSTYVLPNNVATDSSTFTFSPKAVGSYQVTITVTDNDGDATAVVKNLTVTNVAPTINSITGPTGSQVKHTALSYSASVTEPGSENLTYTWTTYRGLELYDTDVNDTYDFTPHLAGSYYVKLVVSDGTTSTTLNTGLINVSNSAPVINTMTRGAATVEGVALTYSADVGDPNPGDEWTYLWELKKGGVTVASATTPTFSAVPANDGSYSMTLTVNDGETTTSQTQNFSVANVAPVASIAEIVGSPIEGSPVNLVATATDVPADTLTYSWTVGHDQTVVNGTGATFGFTPTDDGQYVAQVVVSDGTTTTTVNKTFTVGNNVPNGDVLMPTLNGVTGWDSHFSVEDVAHYIGDAVTIDWDWGNGETTLGQAIDAVVAHRWNNTGTYTVKATFKDDDGGSSFVTKSFAVNDYGMVADPMGEGLALVVNGSGANDTITFETKSGKIKAVRNGVSLGQTYQPTHIIANGDGGANLISANSNVTVPVVFYGGSGKDTLTGGSGNDVLVGKKGIDVLTGGNGRDFLIGGADSDFEYGVAGEDILVGGNHASAENFTQLAAIMGEWGNTSRTFTQRTTRLKNGAEGLAALFASGTVIGDSRSDILTGGTDSDWIFKDTFSAADAILDQTSADRIDNVAA